MDQHLVHAAFGYGQFEPCFQAGFRQFKNQNNRKFVKIFCDGRIAKW